MNLGLVTISPLRGSPLWRCAPAAMQADAGGWSREDGVHAHAFAFSSTQHDSTAQQSKPSKDVHYERENVFVDRTRDH
jgi:hypothetical protein